MEACGMQQNCGVATTDMVETFEQPTVTPYVEKCLVSADTNIFASLFCTLFDQAVEKVPFLEALTSSDLLQKKILNGNAFSTEDARALALAYKEKKINLYKCVTCEASFLRSEFSEEKSCFAHR